MKIVNSNKALEAIYFVGTITLMLAVVFMLAYSLLMAN